MKTGIELKSTSYQSVDRADAEVDAVAPAKTSTRALIIGVSAVLAAGVGAMAWLAPKPQCGALKVYTTTSDGLSSLLDGPSSSSRASVQCSPLVRGSTAPVLQAASPSGGGGASSTVTIDRLARRQTLLGFGGAFTEAAAQQFGLLPLAAQQRVLDLYWGPNGIGYTLGRVPINSCDFSLASYNFDATPNDWDLEHFDTEVRGRPAADLGFEKKKNFP
jgi:glucosylceramidase